MVGMAVAASAEHAFKHSGCCASGWLRESVCTDAVAACAARCLANTNCQFFSHQLECSNVGTNCALCVAGSCSQADVNGPRLQHTPHGASSGLAHPSQGVVGVPCHIRSRRFVALTSMRGQGQRMDILPQSSSSQSDATAVTQPLDIFLSESHATCGHEVHRVPPQLVVCPTVEKCVAKLLSLPASECSHAWFVFADFHGHDHGECTCVPPDATCALDGTPSVSTEGLVTRRMSSNSLVGIRRSLCQLQARPERPAVTPPFSTDDAKDARQGCWLTCHGIDGFGHQLWGMLSMMAFHGLRDRRGNQCLHDACVPFRNEFQHTTEQPDAHRMLRDFMQAGRDRFCDQHSPWRRQHHPAMMDTDIITRQPWAQPKVPEMVVPEMVEDSTHGANTVRFVWTHDKFRDVVSGGGGPKSNSTTEGRPEPHRCTSCPDSNGPAVIMDHFESCGRRIFGQTSFQADPTPFPVGIPPSALESLRGTSSMTRLGPAGHP